MAASDHAIKCILLTLRTENVLVPNAAVAEIVSLREIQKLKNVPRWLLGKLQWRGVEIPLVSFEAAASDKAGVANATQAAILYVINKEGATPMPYVGLAISGVPHISHFKKEQISADERSPSTHPMVAQKIRVNGAAASILDIDAIGNMLADVAL